MTDNYSPTLPENGRSGPEETSGTTDAAKEQASQMKDQVVDSGAGVVDVAKSGAEDIVEEAKTQTKDLFHQTQSELRDQAEAQQRRVAEGLRSISTEFSEMAKNSAQQGVASDLVEKAASRTGSVASWLDDRDPGSLLAEVRRFASRKPGTFIAGATIAGLLVGRLTRSVAESASDEPDSTPSGGPSAGSPGHQSAAAPADSPSSDGGIEPTPVYSSLVDEHDSDAPPASGFPGAASEGFAEPNAEGR